MVVTELYFKVPCFSVKVSERERVVAERFYLKRYSDQWVESQRGTEGDRRGFEETHPRYATLAKGEGKRSMMSPDNIVYLLLQIVFLYIQSMTCH